MTRARTADARGAASGQQVNSPLPDAAPVRTCIGCRHRAPRAELVRWVLVDGQRVRDDRAVLPGRGAWTHDDPSCLDLAERRHAWSRAFRLGGR